MVPMLNFNMLLIDPNSESYRWFLEWLIEEKNFTASEIIGAIYESHKKYYQDLQKEYLEQQKKEEDK